MAKEILTLPARRATIARTVDLILDHSALTDVFELGETERNATLAGLRLLGRIRITTINVLEAAHHDNPEVRQTKLAFYRELAGGLNPVNLPSELLIKTAHAYRDGKEQIELGSDEAMLLLHRPELLTNDFLAKSYAWDEERRATFRAMHEELRITYQEHFARIPTDRARSAQELIQYFCDRLETYLDIIIMPAIERVTNSTMSRDKARRFMDECDAWRVFWAARVHALHTRSVQEQGYGDRRNAGITDLESSIYLAFADEFITADKKQFEALRDLQPYVRHPVRLHWWPDLHDGFLLSTS